MKTLIVYYSVSGPTGKNGIVSTELHKKIGGDIEKMCEDRDRKGGWSIFKSILESVSGKYGDLKPMKTKPGNYDLVVIVTPFWAGKIPPIVRTYLRDNKDSIKKIALLSVSGSGQKNLNTALPDFEKRAGKKSNSTLLLSEQEFATYKENLSGFVERLSRK